MFFTHTVQVITKWQSIKPLKCTSNELSYCIVYNYLITMLNLSRGFLQSYSNYLVVIDPNNSVLTLKSGVLLNFINNCFITINSIQNLL